MKTKSMSRIVAALCCLGMLLSPTAMAAPSATKAPHDVALQQGGVLVGQVVDAQGAAQAEARVSLRTAGREVVTVQTDRLGKFAVPNLRGGVYEVSSVGHQRTYRLWAPNTAPPAAQRGLMLVSNTDLVRGQDCGCGVPSCGSAVGCGSCVGSCGGARGGGPLQWMATHPIITGGVIAAAIAIPLAVDDDDDPATP